MKLIGSSVGWVKVEKCIDVTGIRTRDRWALHLTDDSLSADELVISHFHPYHHVEIYFFLMGIFLFINDEIKMTGWSLDWIEVKKKSLWSRRDSNPGPLGFVFERLISNWYSVSSSAPYNKLEIFQTMICIVAHEMRLISCWSTEMRLEKKYRRCRDLNPGPFGRRRRSMLK